MEKTQFSDKKNPTNRYINQTHSIKIISEDYSNVLAPIHCEKNILIDRSKQLELTVNRLSDFNTKKNNKIETLRKEQMISEIRSLQDRPNISENSKKIFKNYIPIHKRLDEVIKQKNEHIKGLQLESKLSKKNEFKVNCTFQPATSNILSRTSAELTEQTYNWQHKKQQAQEELYKKKQDEIFSNVKLKPTISKKSLLLSVKRSLTPVFERLYEIKDFQNYDISDFKPQITPESNKIIKGKRNTPIFERLYSLRKLQDSSKSPKRTNFKKEQNIIIESDRKYKINPIDGASCDVPMNLAQSKSSKNFLLYTFFNNS